MDKSAENWNTVCENRNFCSSMMCRDCQHADMMLVQRASTYLRCGCAKSPYFETWSGSANGQDYCIHTCADYVEITEAAAKKARDQAFVEGCERKRLAIVQHRNGIGDGQPLPLELP